MSDCSRNVNVWKQSTTCENTFPGDAQQRTPDLSGPEACIIVGTDDPVNDPHLAIGEDRILAKADGTTVALLYLNPDGGGVRLNGSTGGSYSESYNPSTGQYEQILTVSDKLLPVNATTITGTTKQVSSAHVNKLTEITTVAGCQLQIADFSISGLTGGEEMHFFSSGAGGITGVAVSGIQTLVAPSGGTVAPVGRTVTIKYLGTNRWLYIGP